MVNLASDICAFSNANLSSVESIATMRLPDVILSPVLTGMLVTKPELLAVRVTSFDAETWPVAVTVETMVPLVTWPIVYLVPEVELHHYTHHNHL